MSDLGPLLRHPLPDERLEGFFNEMVETLLDVWARNGESDNRARVDAAILRIREFEAEFLDPFGDGA